MSAPPDHAAPVSDTIKITAIARRTRVQHEQCWRGLTWPDTSFWRVRKRPWSVNGPTLTGSTGSKMDLMATKLVRYPTTAPPTARDHHGSQQSQRALDREGQTSG
eukprot:2710851-Rhodomonas_salina.2